MDKRRPGAVALDRPAEKQRGARARAARLERALSRHVPARIRSLRLDLVAIGLTLAIVVLLVATGGRNVAGAPFMLAIPVWMITRTRGARAGAVAVALLVPALRLAWDPALALTRINVVLILLLALIAGIDGRRADAAQPGRAVDPADAERRRSTLTARELEVLRLLGSGHTNKEVAARLGLSVRTIDSHRARIVAKLGSSGRAGLFRHARELGRLDDDDAVGAA